MLPFTRTIRLAILLLPLASTVALSQELQPPPMISSVTATATSVTLAWTASQANRGKITYTINYYYCDDSGCSLPTEGTSTKKLQATQHNLTASTEYYFKISARDNGGDTSESEGWYGPVLTDEDGGSGDECNYPGFSDPPGSSGLKPFDKPQWLIDVIDGVPDFADEFDGLMSEPWIVDDMTDPLNIAGNPDITAGGDAIDGERPIGKRWSAWYNDLTKLQSTIGSHSMGTENGIITVSGIGTDDYLQLGGVVEAEADLTRPGFLPPALPPWSSTKLHTAFLKTWARHLIENPLWDPVDNDPPEFVYAEYGGQKWKAPMYLETKVDFSQMKTPGFRLSMWLMPATYLNGSLATNDEAYDGDFGNGYELDIFEYEPWKPECGNLLEFSWINSFGGGNPKKRKGDNNFEGFEEGYVGNNEIDDAERTIGFLWNNEPGDERIQWIFEGQVVLEITDPNKFPDEVYQYLIVSREMTNGFLNDNIVPDGNGFYSTYLPSEPGLYGWAGGSNIGGGDHSPGGDNYFENINSDKTKIDYIRIYKPQ